MTLVFGGRRYSIIRLDQRQPMPWRNGGGSMRDLLLSPSSAGATWEFDWRFRISVASIDRSGPFSAFPGIDRWFALLSGDGLALEFADREVRLAPGDPPLFFDGGLAPYCRLLGGPAQALNLMVRAGSTGSIEQLRTNRPWQVNPSGEFGLYSQTAGRLQNTAQDGIEVPADCLVWFDPRAGPGLADFGDFRYIPSMNAGSQPSQPAQGADFPPEANTLWRITCA